MTFEAFDRVRVRFPLRSDDWTIWVDRRQTPLQWALGHPLEIRLFRFDFVDVACDGHRLQVEPHYLWSTWDTFWVDPQGAVQAQALRGLFPITLGKQPTLLKGIVSVITRLPPPMRKMRPVNGVNADAAAKIERIVEHLQARIAEVGEAESPWQPKFDEWIGGSGMRASLGRRCWRWKLDSPNRRSR